MSCRQLLPLQSRYDDYDDLLNGTSTILPVNKSIKLNDEEEETCLFCDFRVKKVVFLFLTTDPIIEIRSTIGELKSDIFFVLVGRQRPVGDKNVASLQFFVLLTSLGFG